MKKIVFTLALAVSLLSTLSAQVDGKAIGLRLGGGFGYGAEVSYQHPLGPDHRLEIDLGANGGGFGLNGIYHWVKDLSDLADGFNWYYGFGVGLGSYNFSYNTNTLLSRSLNIGLLGQIGIEYKFEIPITLSLDYRPGIYFMNGFDSSYDGICLAARYRF